MKTHSEPFHRSGVFSIAAPLFVLGSIVFGALCTVEGAEKSSTDWSLVTHSETLDVFQRPHPGSSLHEYKAVGLINAEPLVVKRVLDDVEAYPQFMPYVAESRIISNDPAGRVTYSRLSPPIAGDRDYTIRVICDTRRGEGGAVSYCNRWETANELGPAVKSGVTRVKVTEGSWLLEPAGRQTRASYQIFSDSGGALPAFVLNSATKTAIPKLFDSVRKRVTLPKYSEKHS